MARRSLEVSSNHVYWLVVVALTVCTLFFVGSVQERRGQLRTDRSVKIDSGTVVTLVRVIDADEVSVRPEGGGTFVVRLLGVKGFSTTVNEPGLSGLGQNAASHLERLLVDKPVSVVFDELATDRSGRVLAYLEVEDQDVGEQMVRVGQLVTYTRFAFSREERYLSAEAEARTHRTGLWGNYKAVSRVQGWQDTWKAAREAEEG
ncbi:MAG: thermonuclease family protein [Myxococcales bacterium]|nr:thermonuclease family protein [Myxococcales bacterium]MCB9714172.1 thermonuclease family protein [Myxococcales bacterium]